MHAPSERGTRPVLTAEHTEAVVSDPYPHRRGISSDSAVLTGPPRQLVVVASGIGKRYGATDVVRDVSFEVERGQIFGIVGPSGSGKTTTIRMLLGVLHPTAGDLQVLGRQPGKFRRRDRERIGYMPQRFVLFPELSVMENLKFTASIYGMNWFGRGKKLRAALDFVELWDARSRPTGLLSGGMQRRLALAATLIHTPQLIVLDEPTGGIDPVLRAKFWDHFRQLRDEGRTIIATTQYVTESEYCDRLAVLRDGRVLTIGTPNDIRREAIGGEVAIVSGDDLDRRAVLTLRAADGVKRVHRLEDDSLEVTVDDAGQRVPELLEALSAANIAVAGVEEQHPSFDDVFVRLMENEDGRAGKLQTAP
jgi:ABC-2 type transport system ATP-binding protein